MYVYLSPGVVEGILKHSLSDASLHVLEVLDPEGLGGLNDGYASDLKKIVVTVEEGGGGNQRKIHLVIKTSLSSMSSMSVILGMYVFYREAFWYNVAFPELLKLVSRPQRTALLEMMPVVHHATCNYQVKTIKNTTGKQNASLQSTSTRLFLHSVCPSWQLSPPFFLPKSFLMKRWWFLMDPKFKTMIR